MSRVEVQHLSFYFWSSFATEAHIAQCLRPSHASSLNSESSIQQPLCTLFVSFSPKMDLPPEMEQKLHRDPALLYDTHPYLHAEHRTIDNQFAATGFSYPSP